MDAEQGKQETPISRFVVIDDHRTFAGLLSAALDRQQDLQCVGTAHSVNDGVELCAGTVPDMVVLDYRLPDGSGLHAAERILARDPGIRIAMLTCAPTVHVIQRAASIGVCGFMPKDGALGSLLEVLRTMRTGGFVVAPELRSRPHARPGRGTPGPDAGHTRT